MFTMRKVIALFCGLAVFMMGSVRLFAAPPNIVMIISDDHAWADYSFMGHPQIQTPNIDKLASQGITFRRGYVPSSLCCPSLGSIITGLYPHQNKIACNDPPLPKNAKGKKSSRQDPEYLKSEAEMRTFLNGLTTLPGALGKLGYLSLQTGKWWLGHFSTAGFTHGMSHGDITKNGRHGDEGLDIGRKTMQPIFDFIETATKDNKPFFVWYAPMMPHDPHNPPERILNKYKAKTSLPMAEYWAMIDWFDETCGQLMDYLDQKKLADNTIVVYVTDNGWIQDPDKSNRHLPDKSKLSQYDGGLRTPIMIRWPGKVKPQMSDSLAMSIDLVPTLLAAVGLKPDAGMQGINLLDEKAVAARKAIYGECFTHNAVDIHKPATSLCWRWVIEDTWKLIVPASQNKPKEKIELYNLAKDAKEENNLSGKEAQKVEHLKKLLDQWWPAKE